MPYQILPDATSTAYTIIVIIRKGFIYNGQLDVETTTVLSLKNLIHMYCGSMEGTCLNDKEEWFERYFKEMYLTGTILESTFDQQYNVPYDTDSNNNIVLKTNNIVSESRH